MFFAEQEVRVHEADPYGLLRPSQLLRCGLTVSQIQQDGEGLVTPEIEEQTHLGWMLARFRCEQYAAARRGERLHMVCTPRAVQKAYYIREACISRSAEEIARVRMVWVPVNMETRRIIRVSELEKLFSDSVPKAEIEDVRRLPLPKALPEWGGMDVSYSLCDGNGHLSSANYIDLLCDAFGFWRDGPKRMAEMQIDYLAEFLPEERLTLFGARSGDTVTSRGIHADGKPGFNALFRFVEIED